MFIKLLGGILIIAASGLFGIALSNKYSCRPKDIRKLRTYLQMLETEIVYGATPLPYAFDSLAAKADREWVCFFSTISRNLIEGRYYNVKTAWEDAVDNELSEVYLNKEDRELMQSFGNILGSSDTEDQQKHFKLFYRQLEQQEQLADEDRKKNEKMYKSLGFLLGLVIFIILV
ncbi:MAG: stage III sporulation protein SpoIIIAB [Bacillota bacterium]